MIHATWVLSVDNKMLDKERVKRSWTINRFFLFDF